MGVGTPSVVSTGTVGVPSVAGTVRSVLPDRQASRSRRPGTSATEPFSRHVPTGMTTLTPTRRTVRNGGIGLAVGLVVGVVPIGGLAIAAALWLVGATGGTIVAALGGAFGGVLEAGVRARSVRVGDAAGREPGERSRTRTILAAVGSLLVGGVTFVVVALGVTAALDPYVWPSALLGLPAGAIGGVGVAVLAFHLLTRRTARGRSGGVHPQ